ncbi:MAG: PKD domain-containing protein [Segetibacter sp.]|nr:PKD domain-containing protein [Segetibacter sp.]
MGKTVISKKVLIPGFALHLVAFLLTCTSNKALAQSCPTNIDFESGTFNGWTCYTGNVAAVNGQNVISLTPSGGPVDDRHTMYSSFPGNGVDPYGGFPINCPNGSGHSIKLGNTSGGNQAEGISYEFTIPANENAYTLIYNYAVVFQDPNHQIYEQPRMEIEITNVTDNTIISCSSFTFIPYGTALPGFALSPNPGSNTPVWYKDWSAVSISLAGNAGKKIRLFFKTADCTFNRHFGYAYIDVNSECSGTFVGATYCSDDTAVNVVAPYGYQGYTWYNNTQTQVLGKQQVLTLKPPPARGTTIAVKLDPYNGYGCQQTLFAQLIDSLTVVANAGRDTSSCNRNPVPIGALPKAGLVYKWKPAAGLSNPAIANPVANPDITTTYILTTNHDGGGCVSTDTVMVKASTIDTSLQLIGRAIYCTGSGDSSIFRVQPTDSIQWFKDNIPIKGANGTEYRVTQTGVYRALLFNAEGCSLTTSTRQINISSIPVVRIAGPANPNQCLVGNKFAFTNNSTNAVGNVAYKWTMGDGNQLTNKDVSYTYTKAGTYAVKMVASTSSVCADSSMSAIQVYQNAIADFSVKPVCINMPVQVINNTIDTLSSPVNYSWNLGNGTVSNLKDPVSPVYSSAGIYPISLSVNTPQCPSPLNTVTHPVIIERPKPGISYPEVYAVVNFPLPLKARQLGDSILWTPGINLNNPATYTPIFKGSAEQLYTIEIKTNSGCITIDTQLVKTVKNVEMYVPDAFTPNKDGTNDFLRPLLRGIKQLNYFRIYNRVGQIVFESKTDRPGWDGTFKGVPQPTQAVVWMAEGVGVDGILHRRKGTTLLLK